MTRYVVGVRVLVFERWCSNAAHTHTHTRKQEIATCSYDGTAKIHGLRSGRTLKEFRGHNGYVNNVTYCDRGNMLLTASSDGTVNIYNVKSARLMNTLRPPQANAMTEIPVSDVVVLDENRVLICNRSDTIHVMTLEGKMIRSLSAKGSELHTGGGDVVFVSCRLEFERERNIHWHSYDNNIITNRYGVTQTKMDLLSYRRFTTVLLRSPFGTFKTYYSRDTSKTCMCDGSSSTF